MAATRRILEKAYSTKTTRQHVAYQKYYKEAKASGIKKPLSFKMWAGSKDVTRPKKLYKPKKKRDRRTVRTKDIEGGLKRAGVSKKMIKRLRSK